MRKLWLVVLLAGLVASFAVPSFAAETGENVSNEKAETTEAGKAVAAAALAEQLAELGRAQQSPLILASAAQILGGAGTFEESSDEPTEDEAVPATEGAAEEKTGKGANDSADSLYAEAIALAKEAGDAAMADVLEKQSRVGTNKGNGSGATRRNGIVRRKVYYEWRFSAGRRAEISVRGDGDDIDLYVYDEFGNLIVKDTSFSTVCYVSWTPRWTGKFRVEVRNASRAPYINYIIRTN
jgi:hypothetical protein